MLVCEIDARIVFKMLGAFRQIDIDRSGQISAMELFNHYSVVDTEFNRRAMAVMDDRPPEHMSLDIVEFIAAVFNYCTYDRTTLLHFVFHMFDEDDSGYLEISEFTALVQYVYGRPLTDRVLSAIDACDAAASGNITRDEFVLKCRDFPVLISPAFTLQEVLHQSIVGSKFWKKLQDRRTTSNDDLYQKIRSMHAM